MQTRWAIQNQNTQNAAEQNMLRAANRPGEADVLAIRQQFNTAARAAGSNQEAQASAKAMALSQLALERHELAPHTTFFSSPAEYSRMLDEHAAMHPNTNAALNAVNRASHDIGGGGGHLGPVNALKEAAEKTEKAAASLLKGSEKFLSIFANIGIIPAS